MASERDLAKRKPLFVFSADQSLLATCTSDSRVKVWETKTSTLVVDCSALPGSDGASEETPLGPFTCLAWGAVPLNPGVQGKKKKKSASPPQLKHILFTGTLSGEVIAWDPVGAKFLWRSNCNCPEDDITALAATVADGVASPVVWAGTKSGSVCEISAGSGEVLSSFNGGKATVSSLAVSPKGDMLLVGGPSLKIFDLASRKKAVWKVTGHTARVSSCCFSLDGAFVLSSGENERHVAVWDWSKGEGRSALCTLSTVDAVACFAFDETRGKALLTPKGGNPENPGVLFRVLVVTGTGEAHLWQAGTVAALAQTKPVVIKAEAPANQGGNTPPAKSSKSKIIFGTVSANAPESVTVVRGSVARPRVESVNIPSADDKSKRVVLLPQLIGGDLVPSSGAHGHGSAAHGLMGKQGGAGPEVVSAMPVVEMDANGGSGSGLGGEEGLESASLSSKKSKKKRKSAAEEGGSEGGQAAMEEDPTVKEDGEGDGEGETLEDKLRSLGIATADSVEPVAVGVSKAGAGGEVPRGDSLVVLLHQAVMAEDEKLLESCLAVQDESVIANTVRRLQPQTAVKFLSVAVGRLQSRPQRAVALAPWIRALLLNHAALLMSSPGVQPMLMSLYQEVDARVAMFQPLLTLSGRLDLVVSSIRQIQRQRRKGAGDPTDGEELAGVAVYDEGNDESDVEVEDATAEQGEEEEEGDEEEGEEEEEEDGEEGATTEDGEEMEEGEGEEEEEEEEDGEEEDDEGMAEEDEDDDVDDEE